MGRDLALESGLGARLSLDLVDKTARSGVGRVDGQRGPQMLERPATVVTAIVKIGEQHPNLGVLVGSSGRLERRQRLVRAAGVHGGQAEAAQQRRSVRTLTEALPEEQHGLVGSSLAERVPAPALEAARHVGAPHRAGRLALPRAS